MSNSATRSVSYKPRYTQMEAYDLLPREVRDALKEGPTEYDTGWFLREWRKLDKKFGPRTAIKKTLELIAATYASEIAKGAPWRDRKPGQKWADVPPSPHVACGCKMVLSGLGKY